MMMRKAGSLLMLAGAFACLVLACQSDAVITTTVKSKLATDSHVKASEINVDTKNAVVTLTGNVDSQEAKSRAIQLARDTSGVREVKDMIAVRTGPESGNAPGGDRMLGQRIDDATITMKVKTKLLDDPTVKGLKIDVDTRDGVVYLTGTVSGNEERRQAVELARKTEGVRDVQANWM
jgi:hyperosmotically inducible protein